MEHLFKLKKDGKCVGYIQLQKHNKPCEYLGMLWRYSRGGKTKWTGQKARWPIFDEANPFVTKDKHGNDVFANDKVISSDGLRKYKVIWDEHRCRWWLCGIEKPWAVNEPIWENYELIEDKDA